jgi:tetratricopeptide (TPR) repeat protein
MDTRWAPAVTVAVAEPGGAALLLPAALLVAAALVVAYRARYAARRGGYRMIPRRWQGRPTLPPAWRQARAGEPPSATDTLDARVRGLLTGLDDAVRARAPDPGRPPAAIREAAAETAAALRLRLRLDDPALARNEPQRRRVLEEVAARCRRARDRLPAAGAGPDDAGPAAHADAARGRAGELAGRVGVAEAALRDLAARYAPAATAPVRGHPAAARERLAAAAEALNRTGDPAAPAAARSALDEAEALAAGVHRRAGELARARAHLSEALTAAEADVTEARAQYALRAHADAVERAVHDVRRSREPMRAAAPPDAPDGPFADPFAGLRRLGEVAPALAERLAPGRAGEARNRRARSLLGEALLTARAELAAAQEFVTAHRAFTGSAARTRLAEAAHQLARAEAVAPNDPLAAVPVAWHADALAREGRARAERDAYPVT